MKMQVLIMFSFFFFLLGCEKDKNSNITIEKQDLIGKWVNTQLNTDTLFWNNTIIIRTDTVTPFKKHSYKYELFGDNLLIEYNGEYYILAPKSTHKLFFNNDKSIFPSLLVERG